MSNKAPKAVTGTLKVVDDRFGGAASLRHIREKVFPDHWRYMLGEITLYSFVILLLTGVFLTLWFQPSMTEVTYHGSYAKLQDVKMSEAYASTLKISFDVRGGLLIRQIHHWAAILFMASMMVHMLHVFFSGAYRKPREINWLIGIVLLTLGMLEGLFGYSLPDDLLSGTGLRLLEGVILSIPVVGTYIMFFLFGGEFPGEDIIPRLYIIHVLLFPGIMLALIGAHVLFSWHWKHTQFPDKGATEETTVGKAFYPVFMIKTGAFFVFTFTVCALLGTVAQINPVWMFGPYDPASITAGSQPDFYMGMMEGSLRIMPGWETNIWGYTISWSVFLPALVPLGIIFTGAALWPFLEQWATGDKRRHNILDRARNAPVRTAVGVTAITFYGVNWAAGANDIIAEKFHISLFATTWFFRVTFFIAPVIAFIVTKRICVALQRRDLATVEHGVETGIIVQLPSGEFVEREEPASAEAMRMLKAKKEIPVAVGAATTDENDVPSPAARKLIGKARGALGRFVSADNEVQLDDDGHHGDGHGNGHGNGHKAEVTAGDSTKKLES